MYCMSKILQFFFSFNYACKLRFTNEEVMFDVATKLLLKVLFWNSRKPVFFLIIIWVDKIGSML